MVFRLALDYDMNLYTAVDGNSVKLTPKLNLGQWNMIYAAYTYSAGGVGGVGVSLVIVNGVVASGHAKAIGVYGTTPFSNADKIYVGSGWTGQIRRFQVYSPATIRFEQGNECLVGICCLKIYHRRLYFVYLWN